MLCYGEDSVGCTPWEHLHNVDLLGHNHSLYRVHSERFVLDWDDTCKDTGKYWIQAHREVMKNFGFSADETSDESILLLFGNIHIGQTLGLSRFVKDGRQYSDQEIWMLVKNRAKQLLDKSPMDPLLIEAMITAKSMGVRLAVWSSSPREILIETIQKNHLEDLFDAVISVDDVDADKHKPHPQGLLIAVKAMDIAQGYLLPHEDYSAEKPRNMNGVWMIGDSTNDVLGGKRAGASTVWLENPLQGNNAHEKRKETFQQLRKAQDAATAAQYLHHITPTVTIRTIDPEEAGYARNVSLINLPPEIIRGLTTVNINFAKFFIDRELRYQLYRNERVRLALMAQGMNTHASSDSLESVYYGESTGAVRTITPRKVWSPKDRKEARQSLDRIISKRLEGALI
ncbi:MAG: HAD hydrolase-like protein [Candidatus Saccharibacteria bacterium]